MQHKQDTLSGALMTRAVGCTTEEVAEEYAWDAEQQDLHLIKRKVTKKSLPPDIGAVKTMLELYGENEDQYAKLSDQDLLKEKERLLKILKDTEESDADNFDKAQD